MITPYHPQPGSLPDRVITWFRGNVGEELYTADIVQKFGAVASKQVQASLHAAVLAGVLQRDTDNGRSVYRAGPHIDAAPPQPRPATASRACPASPAVEPSPAEPAGEAPHVLHRRPPARQARPRVPVMFDLQSVTVERVPMPVGGRASREQWPAALAKLVEPGLATSPMPIELRQSAASAIKRYHRDHGWTFTVRAVSDTEIRIWRTA